MVIMDGAGWHADDVSDEFENVTTLKLPPLLLA